MIDFINKYCTASHKLKNYNMQIYMYNENGMQM